VTPTAPGEICAACASPALGPHLSVAGDAGPDGLIPTTDKFGTALSDIVRCARCGHMQLERFPTEAELSEAYGEAASEDYVEEEEGQRETARRVLDRIERYSPRGSMLDLGCWVGFLLAEAAQRGWRVKGVEPSDWASSYARERLGLDVVTADLFEAELPEHGFDAVFLGDVIEHLPRPLEALGRIARLLGPRWWSVIPTHVQYFTRASMRRLLERAGYEPLYVGTQPKAFTVRYYLGRASGYSQPLGDALVGAAEAVGIAERPWAPDFRDRMLVVARPRASA
jgi:SAM-dependent methyltransferase